MFRKKWTLVYSVYVGNNKYVTEYKRIKTNNLAKYLADHDYNCWVIFEGWPKTEAE